MISFTHADLVATDRRSAPPMLLRTNDHSGGNISQTAKKLSWAGGWRVSPAIRVYAGAPNKPW